MSDKITNELQELFKADIVTAETAEKILNYFEKKKKRNQNKRSSVFGILGAIIIGLGIILVFIHN